jgi:hypothetical protein
VFCLSQQVQVVQHQLSDGFHLDLNGDRREASAEKELPPLRHLTRSLFFLKTMNFALTVLIQIIGTKSRRKDLLVGIIGHLKQKEVVNWNFPSSASWLMTNYTEWSQDKFFILQRMLVFVDVVIIR